MLKNETPENLIQLLASYRPVEFAQASRAGAKMKGIAKTVESNCSVTIRFAERRLRQTPNDSEELFSLCSARQQAISLLKTCLAPGISQSNKNGANELVTLRSQYDTFISSVRHFFFLLDRDLAGRIDGALKEQCPDKNLPASIPPSVT